MQSLRRCLSPLKGKASSEAFKNLAGTPFVGATGSLGSFRSRSRAEWRLSRQNQSSVGYPRPGRQGRASWPRSRLRRLSRRSGSTWGDDDMRRQILVTAGTQPLDGGNGDPQPAGKPARGLKGANGNGQELMEGCDGTIPFPRVTPPSPCLTRHHQTRDSRRAKTRGPGVWSDSGHRGVELDPSASINGPHMARRPYRRTTPRA